MSQANSTATSKFFALRSVALLAAFLCAGAVVGCAQQHAAKAPAFSAMPVKTQIARLVDIPDSSEYLATLKSRRSAAINPQVEGWITKINVRSGEHVRQGAALSMGRTGLLTAVPYLAAVLLMLLVSHLSDRTQRREVLVWPFLLLSGLGLLGSFLIAQRSFPLSFVCLIVGAACMYAPYGPYWAIIPERLPRNVTGEVMALINSCGALGGFVGTYFVGFLQSVTGSSKAGFLFMAVFMICSSLLILLLPPTPRKAIPQA